MSSDAMTGPGAAASTGPADHANASRRLLEQSFNDGNYALIDQFVAPDALNHDPALPAQLRDLRGPDGLKRIVTMYREAFPDLRMTVDDVVASEDKVVLRWRSEGTHRGELAGLAPTGVHGSVTGISIDKWKDGKIVDAWAEWNNLGLARQLGAAPPEGSIGEKIGMGLQWVTVARKACRAVLLPCMEGGSGGSLPGHGSCARLRGPPQSVRSEIQCLRVAGLAAPGTSSARADRRVPPVRKSWLTFPHPGRLVVSHTRGVQQS